MELSQDQIDWFDSKLLNLIEEKQKNEEVISIIVKDNLFNTVDRSNNTLLHMTAKWSNLEVAKYLIDSGSILDVSNDRGQTPLMLAAEKDCEAIAEILIRAGAVIRFSDQPSKQYSHDHLNKNTLNFLQKCIKIFKKYLPQNNVELMDRILENGWTLQHAIFLGNVDVTELMIDNKYASSINEKNQLGVTALDVAIFCHDIENVKLLLNYNAVVNVENSLYFLYDCDKSLDLDEKKLQILKELLDRVDSNSIIYHEKERYDYLIHLILASKDKEVVKLMLQHKRFLLARFVDTTLRALASNKIPGVIELLHGESFNVNTRKNRDKETPLMVASQNGNINAMKYFLDAGADIEAVNFLGFSPLFFAVQGFFAYKDEVEECVQLLLEQGADAQTVNKNRALPTIIDAILEYKTFETTGNVVLAHLALQQRLGTPVNEVISSKINSHKKLKTSFELSKTLLSMEIFQSTTLFDLLTESERELEHHIGNEEFVLKLPDFNKQIEKSYYFNNLLQKRLKNANLMVEMRKKAAL